ncbi:hypothetical protein QZH41_007365 [Actinostola sp. cb2023]|nr:hypothetical protein QZH41_007365 [Actinostola sp. cb2023]
MMTVSADYNDDVIAVHLDDITSDALYCYRKLKTWRYSHGTQRIQGTLPRNLPTYKQIYPPTSSISTTLEETLSIKSDSRTSQPSYSSVATLPVKPKRNSSNHYMNKISPSRINERTSDSVCTQKIKPDSMCYNPIHYDNITARMQGIHVSPSNGYIERRQSDQYLPDAPVPRNPDRLSVYDNVIVEPPKRSPERRVSSTKIYLQPPRNDIRSSKTYDPSRYASQEQEQFRQPKVFYQGATDACGSREQSMRSKSYDGIEMSSFSAGRLPYNATPPNYRPSPPSYKSVQQSKGILHNSMVSTKPWYQESASVYSEPLDTSSSPSNLRAISARMIPDKLVCERCCQVPISRQQRICAGCEEETYRRHKQLTDATDMLY